MAEQKEYVKLWLSYKSYFESYSAAEVGRLVLAMIEYRESGASPEFSGSERFIWPAIRRDIDESMKAQEKQVEANRENGKKGGRPKKAEESEEKPENPMGFPKSEKRHGQGQGQGQGQGKGHNNTPSPPNGVFEAFAGGYEPLINALRGFEAMRNKQKKPLTDYAKNRLVARLRSFSEDKDVWVAILNQSEYRCWTDVYELKEDNNVRAGSAETAGSKFKLKSAFDE